MGDALAPLVFVRPGELRHAEWKDVDLKAAEWRYKVTKTEVDHIFPYRIRDYVQYRYVRVWYFRWMPEFLFRALERLAGWHLCLTAVPARRS